MNGSLLNNKGLTLIEVLIALAILSIALTAIIQATSQNIKNTLYLQNKTIATWIATDAINQVRAGVLKLPDAPDHTTIKTTVLGVNWAWQASETDTPNPNIKQIEVDVFQQPGETKLAHLMSYLYVAK